MADSVETLGLRVSSRDLLYNSDVAVTFYVTIYPGHEYASAT